MDGGAEMRTAYKIFLAAICLTAWHGLCSHNGTLTLAACLTGGVCAAMSIAAETYAIWRGGHD